MSQVLIAEKCGVSKQAVSGWLKTGRIDKQRLLKIAAVTNKTVSWFIDENEAWGEPAPKAYLLREPEPIYSISRWPFISVSSIEYSALSERQKAMVEGYIKGLLSESQHVKSNGTTDAH